MFIPPRNVEEWFVHIVGLCSGDKQDRIMRGAFFRNLYLTGDQDGSPATYNKTWDAIEDLAAYTCSTTDLRYAISFPGGGSAVQRAQGQASAQELLDQSRSTDLDTLIEEAALWSYVVGKTFIRMNWSVDGLEPHLIMPEMMGVYRPDLDDLDQQEAFVQSSYITKDQLRIILSRHPDAAKIYKKIITQASVKNQAADAPDQQAAMKQVLLGGYQPYTGSGVPGIGNSQVRKSNGIVQWLAGPYPSFDPRVAAELIRLDELWIRDDQRADAEGRRDWTTMLGVGNCIIFGKEQHTNVFADSFDPEKSARDNTPNDENPLAFRHPYVEFCPNRLKNYFWGRPEVTNLALLQKQLNDRINGINRLLRLQEDPPIAFLGGQSKDDKTKAKLTKPGGWMHDPDPTAKAPIVLAPELPAGLYDSLQQSERMFDVMTGMTPTLQGMASPSVRSHGQTGQLTTNATPRFKKKAIRLERSVQAVANLLFLLLKAKSTNLITAWVKPGPQISPEMLGTLIDPSVEPPSPGLKAVQFYMHDMPGNVRITVDGHSASPAFGDETEQKAILLRKANAMGTPRFIEAINPPDADAVAAEVATLEAEAALAQQKQQQAEAAQAAQGGPAPKGKK
jgi:hypothetical protein